MLSCSLLLVCSWDRVYKRSLAGRHNIADTSIEPCASVVHKEHLPHRRLAACTGPHSVSSDTLYRQGIPRHSCIRYLGRCERRKHSRKSCTFSRQEETFSRDSACFLIVYDQKYVNNENKTSNMYMKPNKMLLTI